MSNPPSHNTKKPGHRGKIFLILVSFVILGVWGIVSRVEAEKALHARTEEQAIPSVAVIEAQAGPDGEDIVLPGTVQAWHEAPIYARTNGYLKSWAVDIGAHVKTGDLLAEIDTPDVDAQMHQAEADLGTAQANDQLAQSTLKRWQTLLKTNSVSKQDADDKAGAAAADDALVASAQANLDRLKQLEDFKRVVAPFDGVITARNTDVGALINAGSGTTSGGQELFHISETDKLRIYAQVPENYTSAIKPDMKAELYFPAYPQRNFPATLASTSDAIDPVTRTLLIQLEVDNEKGELMSGGYAEAHIKLQASGGNVRLPVNTLLFRDGMQVAVIDAGHAVLKRITIGRDYGKTVEVLSGLSAGEKVIVNPPDSLDNGQEVRIAAPDDQKKDDQKP